jgi:hypothetical protein
MADRTIPLAPEHRLLLDADCRRTDELLIKLGQAYMDTMTAHAQLEVARNRLAECEKRVRLAREQQEQNFAAMAASLGLPLGRWTYNAAGGKLVGELSEPSEPSQEETKDD